MKKHNKAIAIFAASAVSVTLAGCSSQVDKIDKYFDETKYDEALMLYKEARNISSEQVTVLTERMRENLTEVINNYASGSAEYDNTLKAINTISSFQLKDLDFDIISAKSQLQSLNASKESYMIGLDKLSKSLFLDAIICFSQVINDDCNFDDAQAKITLATQSYIESILEQSENLIKERNYDTACNLITDTLNTVDQYSTFTSEQKDSIQDTLDNIVFDYVRFLADKNDYENAQSVLTTYQNSVKNTQGMTELANVVKIEYQNYLYQVAKENALTVAEGYARDMAYIDAISQLDTLAEEYSDANSDPDIINKRQAYEKEYVDRVLSIGQKFYDDGKYLRAYRLFVECSKLVTSEKFDSAISKIKDIKPIYLCEIKSQAQNLFEEVTDGDVIIDTLGNEYHPEDLNLFEIESYYSSWEHCDGYAEYYLGYQYDRLTGVVSVDDISDQDHTCTLKIEGDGVTLFSLLLDRKTIPTKVDIDVSGVNYLKFTITDSSEGGHIYAILSEFQFNSESN